VALVVDAEVASSHAQSSWLDAHCSEAFTLLMGSRR